MPAKSKKTVLLIGWFAILGILVFVIGKMNTIAPPPPPPLPPAPSSEVFAKNWNDILAHAAAPARGNPNAPYTMVEFGDFECPQCGKMRPVIEQKLSQANKKVDLVFVHRPFPQLHKYALAAAEASQVAASFGKFWPMYDQLYANQDSIEPGFYGDYAAAAGINRAAFKAALAKHQFVSVVDAASKFCDRLGVQTTPTIAIRDNATGKITVASGADDINKMLKTPLWDKSSGTTVQAIKTL